jgi:hypothetical protein
MNGVTGGQGIPSLDLVSTFTNLRSSAMGMVKGCNYQQFAGLVDNLGGMMTQIRNLEQQKPGQKFGLPHMNLLSQVASGLTAVAAVDAAKAERKALIMDLEEACQMIIQADEVTRTLDAIRAGQYRMTDILPEINETARQGLADTQRAPAKGAVDSAVGPRVLATTPISDETPQDRLYTDMQIMTEEAVSFADAALAAIDSILVNIDKLEDASLVFPDGTGACPEGYPPISAQSPQRKGRAACGPVPAERSAQISRAILQEIAQLKAIDSKAFALLAQTTALELGATANQNKMVDAGVAASSQVQ